MISKQARTNLKGLAFVAPWIIGFCVFTLGPVLMAIYYSLCDHTLLQKPVFIGLANYRDILHDALFWHALKVTFTYAAIAIPAGLMVALGLALLLNARVPGQPIFRTILFLPSLIPLMASAMLWLWLFNAKVGLFHYLLAPLGRLIAPQGKISLPWLSARDFAFPPVWLDDDRLALAALAFMSVWGVGNTMVIFLAGLQDVPRELYEAAEIDGASPLRRLWHVTLPTLSPVIFFNLVMAIIGAFQVFAVPYAMTKGGPGHATYFYSMLVFESAFRDLKMGYASALGLIQLVIVLALTAVAFFASRRWVHYQSK